MVAVGTTPRPDPDRRPGPGNHVTGGSTECEHWLPAPPGGSHRGGTPRPGPARSWSGRAPSGWPPDLELLAGRYIIPIGTWSSRTSGPGRWPRPARRDASPRTRWWASASPAPRAGPLASRSPRRRVFRGPGRMAARRERLPSPRGPGRAVHRGLRGGPGRGVDPSDRGGAGRWPDRPAPRWPRSPQRGIDADRARPDRRAKAAGSASPPPRPGAGTWSSVFHELTGGELFDVVIESASSAGAGSRR